MAPPVNKAKPARKAQTPLVGAKRTPVKFAGKAVRAKAPAKKAAARPVVSQNPLATALAMLRRNPALGVKIAIDAGIVTKKTHKLTKEYA